MSAGPRRLAKKSRIAQLPSHRQAKSAKVAIRQNVLEAVGRDARVFDAFAGVGEMHREVWHQAAGYVGCDRVWYRDKRVAFVADNRRVMRSIDLTEFRVFDFDSFGSPWEQIVILAARRPIAPGERVGIEDPRRGMDLRGGAVSGSPMAAEAHPAAGADFRPQGGSRNRPRGRALS